MTVATTLEKVFRDERPRLYRWMLSLTQQHHFAEDIVQETYITAWQNQHKITDITGIDKWLNAIAYNIYRRWQRQQGTHVSREMPLTDAPQDMLAEYQLDHDELSDLLDNALAMLSPKSRAI
ncbi:MAG: RNA polymerase sigma factor, partial [Chloroflexota bacterium]